jgi:hypothetical protein
MVAFGVEKESVRGVGPRQRVAVGAFRCPDAQTGKEFIPI